MLSLGYFLWSVLQHFIQMSFVLKSLGLDLKIQKLKWGFQRCILDKQQEIWSLRYLDSKTPTNCKELNEQLVGPFPDVLNSPQSAWHCTEVATSLNFPNPVSAEMAARLEGIREKISDVIDVPTPAEHDLAQKRAVPQATVWLVCGLTYEVWLERSDLWVVWLVRSNLRGREDFEFQFNTLTLIFLTEFSRDILLMIILENDLQFCNLNFRSLQIC